MLNHLNWFFFYGKYPCASKHGENRDRKWWSRQQPILSQMAKKIPNSFSIFSSKTLKKQLEESFERKDGARNPFENNLNRSAGLNGNCTTPSSCESGKKCAWMHHQTDEQSSQKPKWKLRKAEWLKFSGNVECAWHLVKHASGRRAAEVFKETTEGHKVLRPMKRAKIHERHTVTESGPSRGKIGSTEPRGVDDVPKFATHQQRKNVSPKYRESQRELRCYFSGVSQRRIEREF